MQGGGGCGEGGGGGEGSGLEGRGGGGGGRGGRGNCGGGTGGGDGPGGVRGGGMGGEGACGGEGGSLGTGGGGGAHGGLGGDGGTNGDGGSDGGTGGLSCPSKMSSNGLYFNGWRPGVVVLWLVVGVRRMWQVYPLIGNTCAIGRWCNSQRVYPWCRVANSNAWQYSMALDSHSSWHCVSEMPQWSA